LEQLRVDVTIRINLPHWTPSASSDKALQADWALFLAALKEHEAGHQHLGRRAARHVLDTLRALRAVPCNVAASTVDRAAQTILNNYHQQNVAYDRDTFHGLTQGVVWPPLRNAPTARPNKPLLQSPQTLIEGAHALRHARQL
jgi:predicted secreted Zn-dependent protease